MFLLLSVAMRGQQLLPFVENFTKSEYRGDNQVWSMAQGKDNAMYFANNHFFLRYNGVKWEKYSLPNNTVIRSILAVGDRIYCGSYREFGYWKRIDGRMKYFSLVQDPALFSGKSGNEEIWKIFGSGNKIYFQSFNELFIYSDQKISKIRFPFLISYCYLIDNKIYVASVRNGIYVLEGNSFVHKKEWAAVDHEVIHSMAKYNKRVFVFTKNSGVFEEQNQSLVPWQNELNKRLGNEIILTAKFISCDRLIIGTGLQGLYIVDMKTGSFQNINRENAIKNNAVLSLETDGDNDLWLGLDNGISHVEINSPVKVFTDNSGILGSVYGLATLDDGYLLATNHGVFSYRNGNLQALPDSQGQVWDIYKIGHKYVIGHNDGTFVYENNVLRKENPVSGGWKFLRSDFDQVFFQANYSGIVYYDNNADLSKFHLLDGLAKPIRNIAQNRPGELWAADNYRSLYRITYGKDMKVNKIANISKESNIRNDFGVKIFTYKNAILFLIDKIWYTYNPISGKLERDAIFNASFSTITDIIPVDDDYFLVVNSGLLYLVTRKQNEFLWELIPEKYYQGRLILENLKVFRHANTLYLNLDDGFITCALDKAALRYNGIAIEGFFKGKLITETTSIKYNQPVGINIVTGHFGYNNEDLFYRLNGIGNFIRVRNGNIVLNSLQSGDQKFVLYAFNGKKYTELSSYGFSVDRPWYFSIWMIAVYVLLLSGSFFLYYRWNKIRYLQKLRLREEELRHQREIMELELKAENELKIQEYEKHILELEIQSKSTEVTGKSLSIAKQGEMISKVQQILEKEEDMDRLKSSIRKAIRSNELDKQQWKAFENNLNQMNDEFVIKLSKKYPNLSSKDIKLCVYLKMNLSSKEIAPLMNITFRGVELQRYRLRKKLGLAPDINLNYFMMSLG